MIKQEAKNLARFLPQVDQTQTIKTVPIIGSRIADQKREVYPFAPEPTNSSDVRWTDLENNVYHIHSFMLDRHSNVLKNLYQNSGENSHLMDYSPNVLLGFVRLIYSQYGDPVSDWIDESNIVEVLYVCHKYDCSRLEKVCIQLLQPLLENSSDGRPRVVHKRRLEDPLEKVVRRGILKDGFLAKVFKLAIDISSRDLAEIVLTHVKEKGNLVEFVLDERFNAGE